MGPLHGPGHDMNWCKVNQEQAKAMKLTWLITRGSREGCMRFQGDKKRLAKGQDLNALVARALQ